MRVLLSLIVFSAFDSKVVANPTDCDLNELLKLVNSSVLAEATKEDFTVGSISRKFADLATDGRFISQGDDLLAHHFADNGRSHLCGLVCLANLSNLEKNGEMTKKELVEMMNGWVKTHDKVAKPTRGKILPVANNGGHPELSMNIAHQTSGGRIKFRPITAQDQSMEAPIEAALSSGSHLVLSKATRIKSRRVHALAILKIDREQKEIFFSDPHFAKRILKSSYSLNSRGRIRFSIYGSEGEELVEITDGYLVEGLNSR